MHALILGASGATGQDLLNLLLRDARFSRVSVFVRKPLPVQHEKLAVYIIDFNAAAQWAPLVEGDVLFSCLGTTLKAAGSQEAQWQVDYDYQLRFAEAARANGVPAYTLVSAFGASAASRLFYNRMKGRLEQAVLALAFPKTIIFRPPILDRSGSDRTGEVFSAKILHALNRIGLLKSQTPLPTADLAAAMIAAQQSTGEGVHIIEGQQITRNQTTA